ncbi:hypothetical protein EV126DRAFT_435746, partial [Verticillium dahliae]
MQYNVQPTPSLRLSSLLMLSSLSSLMPRSCPEAARNARARPSHLKATRNARPTFQHFYFDLPLYLSNAYDLGWEEDDKDVTSLIVRAFNMNGMEGRPSGRGLRPPVAWHVAWPVALPEAWSLKPNCLRHV